MTAANGSATIAVAANSTSSTASVSTTFTTQPGTTQVISPLTPNLYLAAGATEQWTPQGVVLENGAPSSNAAVTWKPASTEVTAPTTASLSATNGIVSQQLAVGPLAAGAVVPVSACVISNGACAQFNVISVSPASAQLVPISGVAQNIAAGGALTPVILEVTDPMGDPMAGAVVTFYETLVAWTPACSTESVCPPAPLVQQQTVQLTSGSDGTAILNPIAGTGGPARLYVTAVTGNAGLFSFQLQQHP